MVMRPQVTPCSEGKLLAIFMPPNGPIHVSNWSRMWWHCRGTAVVAFECDTFLHLILTATARQIAFVAVVSGSEHQGLVIRIELVEYSCIRAVVMHCARALGTQEEEESVGSSDWRRYPQSLHHPQHRTQAKTLHEPDTTGGGYANPTTAKFCNECGNWLGPPLAGATESTWHDVVSSEAISLPMVPSAAASMGKKNRTRWYSDKFSLFL